MKRLNDIKTENGFVTSIDGNAIPRTKLYSHFIVFSNTNTDKCYAIFVDDNPKSYKKADLTAKHPNLTIPCYGQKIGNGKVYQYIDVMLDPNVGFGLQYIYANLETNKVDIYTSWLYGSAITSDIVTPLN